MGFIEKANDTLDSLKKQLKCTKEPAEDDYVDGYPPKRSYLKLIALGAAVCGIEFCYAAETAFVSPSLLSIGVPVAFMSLVWCISPIAGVISVPVLGSMSDGCTSRLGKRRPFIIGLSVVICLGLLVVPNARRMGAMFGDKYVIYTVDSHNNAVFNASEANMKAITAAAHPFGILFTIVGVVFLDFGCDACQSPCRAYLLDVLPPSEHPKGLATFTLMAGLGGSLGYFLGSIDWEGSGINWRIDTGSNNDKDKVYEATSDKSETVFAMVFFIYLIFAAITVNSVKEVPLPKITGKENDQNANKGDYNKFINEEDGGHMVSSQTGNAKETKVHRYGTIDNNTEDVNMTLELVQEEKKPATLIEYLLSIRHMPRCVVLVCITNLFSWMSLVSYSLYFTHFVGQVVFKGDPTAPIGTTAHDTYEQGVRMGSSAMSLYSISCSVYSLNIANLVKKYGAKNIYVISQFVYTIGAALMTVWHTKLVKRGVT